MKVKCFLMVAPAYDSQGRVINARAMQVTQGRSTQTGPNSIQVELELDIDDGWFTPKAKASVNAPGLTISADADDEEFL